MIFRRFQKFINDCILFIKAITLNDFKNILNNFLVFIKESYFFIKKCYLVLCKWYLKAHIRTLYFITEKTLPYCLYLFIMFYCLYGGRDTGVFKTSHYVSLFFVMYIIGSSFQIYLLCKIPLTRRFLDNLLTKEYVFKYLGHHSGTIQAMKLGAPILAAGAVEAATAGYALHRNIEVVREAHHAMNGPDPQQWPPEARERYINAVEKVRAESRHGLMTHAMNNDKTVAVTEAVTGSIGGVAEKAVETLGGWGGIFRRR